VAASFDRYAKVGNQRSTLDNVAGWDAPDPATFVMNSLIPAVARGVELDLESRTAHISVAADQLSLAIGRGGENARLAARLTGWRIDISGEDPADDGRRTDRTAEADPE